MSNDKQSSVEWLVKQLNQKIDYIPMSQWDEITEVIEQAKAMHKEEMCEFAYKCQKRHKVYGDFMIQDYYEQTYGGNK